MIIFQSFHRKLSSFSQQLVSKTLVNDATLYQQIPILPWLPNFASCTSLYLRVLRSQLWTGWSLCRVHLLDDPRSSTVVISFCPFTSFTTTHFSGTHVFTPEFDGSLMICVSVLFFFLSCLCIFSLWYKCSQPTSVEDFMFFYFNLMSIP
jgi:hypothetical protein